MIIVTTLSLLTIHTVNSFSTDWSLEFDYNTYIDENDLFKLYWTDLPNDIIEFGIEVQATGWIALGVSPRGQMPNSDIAIGWVDDSGNVYLQDRYTTGRTTPLYDPSQNLTLIGGEEADGMTRLRWKRPKYSCDGDDMSLSQGTTRLIWAFHATADPTEECFDASSITFHTNKGTQSLNLDSGVPEEIELEDDVETFDILMDKVAVPSTDTTYYCKLFELPRFNETQYIVKMETIVEEGNEATVHHVVAYYCDSYYAEQDHDVTEGDCDDWSKNMPSRFCRGSRILYVWAVGGNSLYMPETAAMPLSGDSGLHYVLIEMHYDNPLEKSGIIDSSGFRIHYTPTARQYDVSTLQFGLSTSPIGQWIPGGLSYAHNSAFLPSACTSAGIPEEGIKVFGSFLHQHTVGRALNLRHIRNGVELPPIDLNLDYDFNYQQTIVFDEPIVLLPGDEFILDCYTDTSSRTAHTTGGESSSQEMCFAFLFYYPAIPLITSTNMKIPESLGAWMYDAQQAGYLSGNLADLMRIYNVTQWWGDQLDFTELTYYSEKDGALEFYNRLWSVDYPQYNRHFLACATDNNSLINAEQWDIPRYENFTKYALRDSECENVIDVSSDVMAICEETITGTSEAPTTTEIPTGTSDGIITGAMLLVNGFMVVVSLLNIL